MHRKSQVEDDYGPLWFGTSSEASIDPNLQELSRKGLAGGPGHNPALPYSQLFHLFERRSLIRILRVLRHGLCSGHGPDGRGSQDPGMVVAHDANATATGNTRIRGMVGLDGRGIPYGLRRAR